MVRYKLSPKALFPSPFLLMPAGMPVRPHALAAAFDLAGAQPSAHAAVLEEDHAGDQARIGRRPERAIEMGAVRSGTALMGVA